MTEQKRAEADELRFSLGRARAEITRLTEALAEATRYAETFVVALVTRMPDAPPQWRPLNGDLIGLLMQIDNATMGFAPESALTAAQATIAKTQERGESIAKQALEFAVMTLAFHGRDRGTNRQEGMLDDLEGLARKMDEASRTYSATLAFPAEKEK